MVQAKNRSVRVVSTNSGRPSRPRVTGATIGERMPFVKGRMPVAGGASPMARIDSKHRTMSRATASRAVTEISVHTCEAGFRARIAPCLHSPNAAPVVDIHQARGPRTAGGSHGRGLPRWRIRREGGLVVPEREADGGGDAFSRRHVHFPPRHQRPH